MSLTGEDEVRVVKRGLTFNKPIISTPQKPIASKDLLIRLQQLSDELSTIDQENPDLKSFNKIKDDLVNPKLLKSSNPGVQAYVCCGIADILRIYAPDAPFTATDLSHIFRAFFNQFKKLGDPNNPYFQQQCYVLKRLAEVRSIILITDIKDSEALIEMVFNVFYDLSNKDFPSRLEPLISDILSEVMAEAEIVPHNVLKMILDRLLTHSSTTASTMAPKSKITNPGFNFSVSICEANIDRMSRQVAQFFSEMLYESAAQIDNANDKINSFKAMESLRKIHKLSIQIWSYVPGLLTSVMGLIHDELNAEDETIRILATETIGQMIGCPISSHNFIITYKDTWQAWLKKASLDVSPAVRCKWIEQLPFIVNNMNNTTSEVSTELCDGLNKCLMDVDEKVRLFSCISIEKIPFEKFTRICDKNIMATLFQLIRERNPDIRNQAIKILSNHCNQYLSAVDRSQVIDFGGKGKEESDDLEKNFFKHIPNQLLSLIYINEKEITSTVDICLFEKLLPFENNTITRTHRLCQFFNDLDEKSKKSFFAINQRQQQYSNVVKIFIELCEQYGKSGSLSDEKENVSNLGKSDSNANSGFNLSQERQLLVAKLEKTIKWFCVSIPDGFNPFSCFERFYKLKNFRFLHLIKLCISPESDFGTVKNSLKEFLTKLTNPRSIRLDDERGNNISTSDMVSCFKLLLYRSSMILYNKSNIIELINYSKDASHEWNHASDELLKNISATIPDVFKNHVDNLIDMVNDEDVNHLSRGNSLKTIYHFVKKYPDLFSQSSAFGNTLEKLCQEGTSYEAKYSMKLIGLSGKKELYCSEIVDKIYPINIANPNLATHLATISQLFLVDPVLIEGQASDMTAQLIKELLLVNEVQGKDEGNETDDSWIDCSQLHNEFTKHSKILQKLSVLDIFANRLRAFSDHEVSPEEVSEVAKPIMKLFSTIIANGGEIVKDVKTPVLHQMHLRLKAGLLLLKLSKEKLFHDYFTPDYINKMIYLVQDQNPNIRKIFLTKLQKYLSKEQIPEKFLTMMFFMCNDPDEEILFTVNTWIRSNHKRLEAKKNIKLERSLIRLIHLISHNESFVGIIESNQLDAYRFALEVFIFFMKNIINSENISLLYYLASRVKQFRDGIIDQSLYETQPFPKEVNNLYCVAELCQLVIKEYSVVKNWPILSWPGKIQLPGDLFSPMMSTGEAQAIISKVYIGDDIQIGIRNFIRLHLTSAKKRGSKRSGTKINGHQSSKKLKIKSSKPKATAKGETKSKQYKGKKISKEPIRHSNRTKRLVNYEDVVSSEPDIDEEDLETTGFESN